jgi:hypothetical protein
MGDSCDNFEDAYASKSCAESTADVCQAVRSRLTHGLYSIYENTKRTNTNGHPQADDENVDIHVLEPIQVLVTTPSNCKDRHVARFVFVSGPLYLTAEVCESCSLLLKKTWVNRPKTKSKVNPKTHFSVLMCFPLPSF